MWIRPLLPCALALAVLVSAGSAGAANFTVNVTSDGLDEDGVLPCDIGGDWIDYQPNVPFNVPARPCSLRAAVQLAHVTPEPDVIALDLNPLALGPVTTFKLKGGGAGEDDGLTGDIDIHTQIQILGEGNAGSDFAFLQGAGDRIFDIHPGGHLTVRRVNLMRGKSSKKDADPSGGCVRNAGTLVTGSVFFFGCSSSGDGGCLGLVGDGTADLDNTIFSTCKAKGDGGGLWVGPDADADLMRATFGRNSAANGGALATHGDLTLSNVTIDRNVSKLGAGGVAVLGAGTTAIHTTTISENGAINFDATENTGALSLSSSIVWGAESADCMGDVPSAGGNLEGGTSCDFTGTNDQQGEDPLLAPINNYGGLVPTRTLAAGSPAIDNGIDDFESQCPRDARNLTRFRSTEDGVADTDAGATDFPGTGMLGTVEITSVAPTQATQHEPFVYDVEATNTNGVRPQCITFSLGAENFIVPEGVAIDARTGLITWTPPLAGEALFPVNASDPGGGPTDQQEISLEILAAPQP